MTRLCLLSLLLAAVGCAGDGHFCVLGYSTKPNYDTRIKTVSVPMVKNRTTWAVTPVVGMEQDLHRILIDQIQLVTPYRVVQNDPDTELNVIIRGVTRNLLNRTEFNTTRETELVIVADVYWRDLRSGELLSRAARRPGEPGNLEVPQPIYGDRMLPNPPRSRAMNDVPDRPGGPASDEDVPVDPRFTRGAEPIQIRGVGNFRAELGESFTTAETLALKSIARQIVSAMEMGW